MCELICHLHIHKTCYDRINIHSFEQIKILQLNRIQFCSFIHSFMEKIRKLSTLLCQFVCLSHFGFFDLWSPSLFDVRVTVGDAWR